MSVYETSITNPKKQLEFYKDLSEQLQHENKKLRERIIEYRNIGITKFISGVPFTADDYTNYRTAIELLKEIAEFRKIHHIAEQDKVIVLVPSNNYKLDFIWREKNEK